MKFNMESPVFRFLETMTDFIVLNVIFLCTCIPVITIGPAVCALFSVTLQEAREEHGYMVRPYLQALKANFKSAFQLSLIYAAAGAVLLFNLVFWIQYDTLAGKLVFLILVFCSFIYLFSLCYGMALNARFENTVRRTLKNSILIALSNMKYSVVLLLLLALSVTLYCMSGACRIFFIIFGFAFISYCQAYILVKVFEKYEPERPVKAIRG